MKRQLRTALTVLAALGPCAALALDGADHPNVEELPRPDFLRAKPTNGFELPPVAPAAAPAASGGKAVRATRTSFRGNHAIATAELDAIAAPYVGRQLNAADIEDLRERLTRHYIDRGYINSGALIGKDAIANGVLTVDIVEGRLSAVRLRGLGRLNENYVVKRLVKDADSALNADVLRERFQLLLDDPLFERMNARLIPGANLGEAILDVDVVRARPYRLTLAANNYRPPSIGSKGYVLSGWVRDLTGYGDTLDASVQDDTSLSSAGRRYSLGWHVPVNQSGTQVSLQLDHGRSSVIEQPMDVLDIKSILDSKDIGISQAIFETLRQKLTFGINRADRKNSTTMLGQPYSFTPGEPNGVTKVSAWRFWQEYAWRDERQVLALRSSFTWAKDNLQDIPGLPPTTSEPAHSYHLWLGQAQFARQVLDNGAQVIVRASMQRTGQVLVALDRMSIGGINTVRGYRENQLVRDTGTIVNLEFDYPVVRAPGNGLNVNLVPFYDNGRGKNLDEASDTISSWGIATRVRWQRAALDLAIAHRLKHPPSITTAGGSLQDKGIHVQFSYSFF